MPAVRKPLQVVFYYDVLCVWSYVADIRLEALRLELGLAMQFKRRPFLLQPARNRLKVSEIDSLTRDLEMARKEPEGKALSSELWSGRDVPGSTLTALAALEAARLQGPSAHATLLRAMQRAALEQGINVTRPDVVLEIAAQAGLDMNRFSSTYSSEETQRLVHEERRAAVQHGVKNTPTLVVNGRWMVSGLHELAEYRERILSCLGKVEQGPSSDGERILH